MQGEKKSCKCVWGGGFASVRRPAPGAVRVLMVLCPPPCLMCLLADGPDPQQPHLPDLRPRHQVRCVAVCVQGGGEGSGARARSRCCLRCTEVPHPRALAGSSSDPPPPPFSLFARQGGGQEPGRHEAAAARRLPHPDLPLPRAAAQRQRGSVRRPHPHQLQAHRPRQVHQGLHLPAAPKARRRALELPPDW